MSHCPCSDYWDNDTFLSLQDEEEIPMINIPGQRFTATHGIKAKKGEAKLFLWVQPISYFSCWPIIFYYHVRFTVEEFPPANYAAISANIAIAGIRGGVYSLCTLCLDCSHLWHHLRSPEVRDVPEIRRPAHPGQVGLQERGDRLWQLHRGQALQPGHQDRDATPGVRPGIIVYNCPWMSKLSVLRSCVIVSLANWWPLTLISQSVVTFNSMLIVFVLARWCL